MLVFYYILLGVFSMANMVEEVLNHNEGMGWESRKHDFLYMLTSEGHEGGYVDNPIDPGGETNFGITKKRATDLGYTGNMKDLTRSQAINYYKQPGSELTNAEANFGQNEFTLKMADIGINAGPQMATQIMQYALNDLGNNLSTDGKMGNKTRYAFAETIQDSSKRKELMDRIIDYQKDYYSGGKGYLKQIGSAQVKEFEKGWHNRAEYRGTWGLR
jgi:lysozyme family protein